MGTLNGSADDALTLLRLSWLPRIPRLQDQSLLSMPTDSKLPAALPGDNARMRALPNGLELPAGKTVELKPGGFHVMLMDLKAPLNAGATVDVSLVVEGPDGQRETIAVKAPVKALATPAAEADVPATDIKFCAIDDPGCEACQ